MSSSSSAGGEKTPPPPPAASSKRLLKPRRSIDMECHEMLGSDLDDSSHFSAHHSSISSELSRLRLNNKTQQDQPQQHNQSLEKQESHGNSNNNNRNKSLLYNSSCSDLSSSEEDSFGEASINCKPVQNYLDDLLDDEYHPERVNLLDNTPDPKTNDDDSSEGPRLKTKNGIKIREYSDHDDDEVSISSVDEEDNDFGSRYEGSSRSSWNSSFWSQGEQSSVFYADYENDNAVDSPGSQTNGSMVDRTPPEQRIPRSQKARNLQVDSDDDDDESDDGDSIGSHKRGSAKELEKGGTEDESAPETSEGRYTEVDTDDFEESPVRKPSSFGSKGSKTSFGSRGSRPRPKLKESLQTMGTSTKKSLRTINGRTFWSQPFKGITKNRRTKKADILGVSSATADSTEQNSPT
mmetsp:Transcript_53082/g.128824  ORF Transcript_53082/g.128824 Transcript_53082/m.128824 type:complete len:407 (-) Transcript_53082:1044-2264(-)